MPSQQNPRKERYSQPRTKIPENLWSEITQRKANGESLRELAGAFDVSYEAVRQVLKKVSQNSNLVA